MWWLIVGSALIGAWCLRARWRWSVAAGVMALIGVGGALMQHALQPPWRDHDVRRWIGDRAALLCEGVIAERPERMPDRARAVVAIDHCLRDERMEPAVGRVLIYAPTLAADLDIGLRVRLRATLHPPTRFLNPGTETIGLKWLADDIVATGSLADAQWITPIRDEASLVGRWLRTWRRAAEGAIDQLDATPEVIGVLRAMILGQGETLEQPWWDRFRRVGVIHLLVVSGLHITAVAMVLYWSIGWLWRRSTWLLMRVPFWRVAALGAIGGSWLYTWLTGANIPAQRSAWFITLLFAGRVLDRRHDLWSAMALSGLVLAVLSPLVLWLPSFQLTFAAVIGIAVYLSVRAHRAATHARWQRVIDAVAVTLAATIAVTPIVAYHFHETSLMGLFTNLIFVPWVSLLVTPLGMIFISIAPWWPGAAVWLGTPLVWLTTAFTWLTARVDAWSGAWQLDWVPYLSDVVVWYLAWSVVALWGAGMLRWRQSWARRGIVISACVMMVVVTWTHLLPLCRADALRIMFLDVGQGSAAVVQFPNGQVYLVDGGGVARSGFDIGRWVVAPALRRLHIDRVDTLLMTHYHPDHYGGLAYVAEVFGAQRLFVNGSQPESGDDTWHEIGERIAQRHIPVQILNAHAPPWQEGAVQLRVVHPDTPDTFASLHENDRSIVLELTYGTRRILLTGDIESTAEQSLVAANALRPVDLVVAPHHGSNTSSTPAWVHAVQPRHAVISCGRHNRYRFPRESVLRTYEAANAQIWRTDRHGAISLWTNGHDFSVEAFTGGQQGTVPDVAAGKK